jgi:tight adherence protein C
MTNFAAEVVITLLVTVVCGLGAAIIFVLLRNWRPVKRLMQVTRASAAAPEEAVETADRATLFLVGLVRLVRTRLGLAENEALRQKLMSAGMRHSAAMDIYFGMRLLGPVVAALVGTFIHQNTFLWIVGLMGLSYIAPDMWVSYSLRRRRERIRLGLPDALDLMVVCVDAGLGVDQAMLRAGQELAKTQPEISEEFIQVNFEQRAGKPRLEAWQSMADRTGVETVKGFVHMLAQTDRFGTPLVRALRVFADGVRQKRRQQAEELAAKTTVKLIFPLVLFIFPSVFIVLLGPAVILIARNLQGMFK